jgi:hypothetical protein
MVTGAISFVIVIRAIRLLSVVRINPVIRVILIRLGYQDRAVERFLCLFRLFLRSDYMCVILIKLMLT